MARSGGREFFGECVRRRSDANSLDLLTAQSVVATHGKATRMLGARILSITSNLGPTASISLTSFISLILFSRLQQNSKSDQQTCRSKRGIVYSQRESPSNHSKQSSISLKESK